MICNTLVKHELASGEYNLRRADCEAAVLYLKEDHEEITSLRDVTLDVLESGGHNMPDVAYRRARHVVRENMRVQAAAEALSSGDLQAFGVLMGESHRSLRDDYEVSCKELDLMVELAERCRGVYGARMTGGGFGGCTVNLVSANGVDRFKEAIEQGYKKATGVRPEIYVCKPADGASEISEGAQT
jgi:galactokinase